MANTLLTPTAVTREALRILHQKCNFIGTIDRQYDNSFARSGAKIGDLLKIRLPNEYTVRTGRALAAQDTLETSVDLRVQTQKGVDMQFTSAELTLSLQDFSQRIIAPAMSVLAANIEADVMNVYKTTLNQVYSANSVVRKDVLKMSRALTDSLVPTGRDRTLNLNTGDNQELVNDLSGLFNPQANISRNYREGMVADQFLGFGGVYENTIWPRHTTGDAAGKTVNGGSQSGTSITVSAGTGSFNEGDIVTFADVNRVHPETKADTGQLAKFAVVSNVGTNLTIAGEGIVPSGGRQNCSKSPDNGAAIALADSIAGSTILEMSLGYAKDAYTFATADLEMPNGVDFGSRQVMDGISMRIIRDYDINQDNLPCRVDVLYGYVTTRGSQACRGHFKLPA